MLTRRSVPSLVGFAGFAGLAVLTATLVISALPASARQAPPAPGGPEAGPPPASPDGRTGRGPRGARGGGESLGVEAAMKLMDRSLDRLETLVDDPSKSGEALTALGEVQRGCLASKNQPAPREILERAGDDAARTALSAEYRRDLLDIMRALLDTEDAILAGDPKRAKDSLTKVSELRKKGHERFGVREH